MVGCFCGIFILCVLVYALFIFFNAFLFCSICPLLEAGLGFCFFVLLFNTYTVIRLHHSTELKTSPRVKRDEPI